jgi:hypothetical protein
MDKRLLLLAGLRLVFRKLEKITVPLLSSIYRKYSNNFSDFMLTILGIANPKFRVEFYTLDRITRSIERFDGAVVECGVYKGSTLLGIAHLLKKRKINTRIYGFDSFEGFPEPTTEDAKKNGTFHKSAQKGFFRDASYEVVIKKINRLGFGDQIIIIIIKGFFEDTLPQLKNEKFKLVHLDVDLYQSYKTCLEFFYDKVISGGYIVFDEYGSEDSTYPGSKKAIDEFLSDKPERLERFDEIKYPRYFIKKI